MLNKAIDTCKMRVYDQNFNWLAEIHNAESVQLSRELYGVGQLEIHIHPDKIKNPAEIIRRNNIIVIDQMGRKSAIIRDFYISENREKSEFVIYGVTGNGLTKDRITVPPNQSQDANALGWDKINSNAETVIKHYAGRNLVTPYDLKRKIPNLIMPISLNRGVNVPWKSRYSLLNEELYNMCSYTEMGYEIYADTANKRWIFDVIPGTDRTKTQTTVSPVLFTFEYGNVENYKYTEDFQNYKSTGYAGGAGKDEKRLIQILGAENTGIDRHEVFLDCGNVQIGELVYYGEQKLNEYKAAKNVDAAALPRVFTFEDDYFLGDKVSVYISKLGISIETRITAVKEVWERETGYRTEVNFGGRLPNVFNILNKSKEVR